MCAGPDGHRHNADTQRNERDDAELPDSEHCLDRRPEEAYEREPCSHARKGRRRPAEGQVNRGVTARGIILGEGVAFR